MPRKFRSTINEDFREEPTINLTPLIDVVFVVLITFILIAPVIEIDSIDLATGGEIEKQELKSDVFTIFVHADNSIWHQNTQISLSDLKKLLQFEKSKKPKLIPQVLHDEKAEFGTYQKIKNTLESLGFEQMDLVLKPK